MRIGGNCGILPLPRIGAVRIGLVDVDGHNYPNLALMKLSAWHKAKGDKVEWCVPLLKYDLVYQSRVFDDTYSRDISWIPQAGKIIRGGTGYGLTNALPEEIEHCYPDYGLYEITDTAYGFLTRGCPRNCDFCIVSEKEGRKSHQVAELAEFWSGQRNIELLDPNLLACKNRERLLNDLADSGAYVNFSQGLDIRLTDKDITDLLNRMRVKRLHFAWDNPKDDLREHFARFSGWYKRKDPSKKIVYVLANFNRDLDEDLYRIYTLRDLGYDPYVMIYDKPNAPKEVRQLQRWCNNRRIFRAEPDFSKYDPKRR